MLKLSRHFYLPSWNEIFIYSLVEITLTNIPFCIDHTISTPAETGNEKCKNEKHIVWLDMEVRNCYKFSNSAMKEGRELKGTEFFR